MYSHDRYTSHVFGFESKIGKGNAWLYLATAANAPYIVFVEEDFNRRRTHVHAYIRVIYLSRHSSECPLYYVY